MYGTCTCNENELKKKQHLYQLLWTCIITSVCFVVYAKKYGCNILSLILNESVVCYKKILLFSCSFS